MRPMRQPHVSFSKAGQETLPTEACYLDKLCCHHDISFSMPKPGYLSVYHESYRYRAPQYNPDIGD